MHPVPTVEPRDDHEKGRAGLGILDLVPLPAGGRPADAVAATRALVQRAEAAGYRRYLFAEHHFSSGLLGSSPAVLAAIAGASTSRIVVGSGAVQLGATSVEALVAEEFALLAAALPHRVELGLGRSVLTGRAPAAAPLPQEEHVTAEGLLVPKPFDFGTVVAQPGVQAVARLLGAGADEGSAAREFSEQVQAILDLFRGDADERQRIRLPTIEHGGQPPALRLYGSNTATAELAGRLGLPFAANYHTLPAGVIRASQAYLRAFNPSEHLPAPHLIVSVDVVAARTRDEAFRRASGYPAWVRAIRRGLGAIPYPSPADAAELLLDEDDQRLVDDRVRTRFVGTGEEVAAQLDVLQRATGADELLLTTIVHDAEARVQSFELIAQAWNQR